MVRFSRSTAIGGGWTRHAWRASNTAHEDATCDHLARRSAPRNAVAVWLHCERCQHYAPLACAGGPTHRVTSCVSARAAPRAAARVRPSSIRAGAAPMSASCRSRPGGFSECRKPVRAGRAGARLAFHFSASTWVTQSNKVLAVPPTFAAEDLPAISFRRRSGVVRGTQVMAAVW